jgi:transcription antitermination factor NusG
MEELRTRAAASFLAIATTSKVYQRRRIETQVPLFPGYVFAAGHDEQLSALWRLRHVSTAMLPPSQPEFVRELSAVYRLMLSGSPMTPEQLLQPGELARITRGSLKGLEGAILRNDGGLRLIVGVTWLGQGVSVAVTTDMLERVRSDDSE